MNQVINEELEKHKEVTWEEYLSICEREECDQDTIYFIKDIKSERQLILQLQNEINELREILNELRGD